MLEKLVKMVGFRNRIIHEYEKLNFEIVYSVYKNKNTIVQDVFFFNITQAI